MARVLFFVQLIAALVVLPFWPGLDPRYSVRGLQFLALVLLLPWTAVAAVLGWRTTVRALADAWSPGPLRPGGADSVRAWDLASRLFPLAGVLAALVAAVGALSQLDAERPAAPQMLLLVFFCLVWGFLGLLLGRVLHGVVARLGRGDLPPLLVIRPDIASRFGLTPRESEAAQAVLDGLTYQGAAEKLGVASATVKSHVLSVYQKTGVGNKIELLRLVEAETRRLPPSVDGLPTNSGRS